MSAVSDEKVKEKVDKGIIPLLAESIKTDSIMFGLEVYYAMQCLLRIAQVENQKYTAKS